MGARIDKLFVAAGQSAPDGRIAGHALEHAMTDGWLASVPIGRRATIGSILGKQARFAMASDGTDIVGTTAAARKLLDGPDGAHWRSALSGWHRSLTAAGGVNELKAASLASSGTDFAIGSLLNWSGGFRRDRLRIPARVDRDAAREVSRAIRSDGRVWPLRLGGANAEDGRIALGPTVSKQLVRAVEDAAAGRIGLLARRRGESLAYILRHEGEHVVTPTLELDQRTLQFEEAVADVLARWPGAVADTAREMGVAHHPPSRMSWVRSPFKGYVDYAANMRGLLELGGLDTSASANRAIAASLLQHDPVEGGVARAIATRIVDRHGTRAGTTDEVAERVVDAAIDRRQLKRLARDLDDVDAMRVVRAMRRDTVLGMAMEPLGAAALGVTGLAGVARFGDRREQVRAGGIGSVGVGNLALDGALAAGAAYLPRIGGIRIGLPLALAAGGPLLGTTLGSIER